MKTIAKLVLVAVAVGSAIVSVVANGITFAIVKRMG